jgi:hypothetical protein
VRGKKSKKKKVRDFFTSAKAIYLRLAV